MKVIKHDNTGSILIDTKQGFNVWVDVWNDSNFGLLVDWNKYIFNLRNENDLKIQEFQNNSDNCEEAFNLALDYWESNDLK